MSTKKIVMTAIAGAALVAASGAQARDDHDRGHGYRHQGHHHRHVPHRVFVRQAPVYYYAPAPAYYPAPVYYPPQPVYYAPPRPVIFSSLPLGDARVRIGLQF